MEALPKSGYSGSLSKRCTWLGELSLVTRRSSRNGGTHFINTSSCSVSRFGRIRRTGRFWTNLSRCLGFEAPSILRNSRLLRHCVRRLTAFGMAVWRVLLNLSVTLLPTNGVVGIDASGFDRSHASKHYTKRTKLTIQQLKVTLLVDTRVNAIIDLHVTTTRKHDSKIAPSLIRRNTDDVTILLGDRGI